MAAGTGGMSEQGTALVSTEWLAANLGMKNLTVCDASFYLPTENIDPHEIFRQQHIPGAVFFDIEALADPETDLPHMIPGVGRFASFVGGLGMTPQTHVVVYDQKGLFSAARAWWLLRLYGHCKVSVLDGGLPKWQAEGRAIETGEVMPVAVRPYPARLYAQKLRGLGDVWENIASGKELLIDARSAGRFDGSAPEPRPGLPSGHVPGAQNLPASSLLAADQTLLPAAQIKAKFAAIGDDGSRPIVTSCGTGVTAAILTLARVVAGLAEGSLYDGSWTEWASHADTPKVSGP
jgi:thiosulfate/3-mercaptopyruvate sulfurtransferase